MALVEEFETQGNFLFRWRSYIPGIILVFCAFFFPGYRYPNFDYQTHLWYEIAPFCISILGLFVRCFTIGFTPRNTSGRNTKEQVADVVNQTGIYSLVRHPLYLGNFLIYLGPVLFFRNWIPAIFFILFFALYYERIMLAEEQFLRKKFGEEYLSWAKGIPAFFPRFKGWIKPNASFSFRNVLKREYPTLFGILVIFTLFDFVATFFNEPIGMNEFWLAWRPEHTYVMGGGLAFYLIVRILAKTTKLLQVEGR